MLGSATRNDDLTGKIIGCAIEIHRHLGPVLLESIYESALAAQLELQGIRYKRQIEISHKLPWTGYWCAQTRLYRGERRGIGTEKRGAV